LRAADQGTVRELCERRAALAPEAVALVAEGRGLTYGELDRRANRLAHRLIRLGVGPEVLVALHLGRGLEMVVAMLAVHKAGGAYVPLDPSFPKDRLELMVRDAAVRVVLAEGQRAGALAAAAPVLAIEEGLAAGEEASPARRALPGNLAYVIYTSGSTGRPKGVQVTHAALANFLLSMAERPGFTERDVLLAVTTLSFDIAALEIFLPLVAGGRLVVAPREVTVDGARLAALLAESGATALQATPITWKLLLQAGWPGSQHLQILCGGEALPRELAQALLARGAALWNLYGPTETTVWSAVARIAPGEGPVPIGGPVAATDLLILDEGLRQVPAGVAGSLSIGGAGLARGYLGQPALTAERFTPHPWSANPGERLYATGDLALRLPDGQLECLGRTDHQVKIRGFRIELGEIESVLLGHPGVRDAVVVAAPGRSGEKRLVAYLVPRESPPPALAALEERVASRLPEYMRPAAYLFLAALPLTPNNKVDRRALPEVRGNDPVALPLARTPTEEVVLGVWADLLERGAAGLDDDFFAAGGHSLLAGQVTARLREALGLELPPGILFDHPTPARLALEIDSRRRAGAGVLPALAPLAPAARRGPLPVSYAQERLWLYDQLEPGSNAFNIAYAFRLRGRAAVGALDRSLGEIVRRHEVLRTRIVADPQGHPCQVVDPPLRHPLRIADLSGLPAAVREREVERAVLALHSLPFDLARGPLLRPVLVTLAEDDRILSLTVHHILCDGWSLGVLIRELTVLYEALASASPPALPALPVQYADFAAWQRQWLHGALLEEQLGYWCERLGGRHPLAPLAPLATLPMDRAPSRVAGAVAQVGRAISGELLEALLALGREQGATLFMTLLAAIQLLLYRYTGSARIVVGSLHANRGHSAVEDLIGFFVNVLPLPTDLSPDWTFRELLCEVRATALSAYAHQDAPYEKILERVRPDRAAGRNALFQVMVVLQNVPLPPLALPGLEVAPFAPARAVRRAAFDLTFTLVAETGQLSILLEYDTELFDRTTIERLHAHFARLLRDIAADPARRLADLPHLDEAERRDGVRPDGTLWLTDPAHRHLIAERRTGAVLLDQVAARRAQLSEKKQALLQQRLRK
jgi:amino acid adenylation domain-containing protein